MTRSRRRLPDAAHMRGLAAALVRAGNPVWSPWRPDFEGMYLELTEPLDIALAVSIVGDDARVEINADHDRIRCSHCDHEVFGYAASLELAEQYRVVSRAFDPVSRDPGSCEHLEAVLDGLLADGNSVVSEPTFAPIGSVLQCEVRDRIDMSAVLRRLPPWSRVVTSEADDEIYCRPCWASIAGPGFPWNRSVRLEVDYSKLDRVGDEPRDESPRKRHR